MSEIIRGASATLFLSPATGPLPGLPGGPRFDAVFPLPRFPVAFRSTLTLDEGELLDPIGREAREGTTVRTVGHFRKVAPKVSRRKSPK